MHGNLTAHVSEIGRWDRLGEQFFDHGHEVMKGANRSEGHRVGGASGAAEGGQQESSFDDRQRDLALPEYFRDVGTRKPLAVSIFFHSPTQSAARSAAYLVPSPLTDTL